MVSEKTVPTYLQVPWRRQLRLIGLFVFGLLLVAVVARLYLHVSARIAETGKALQDNRVKLEEMDRQIAHLESRLAILLSANEMEKRAREMGFKRVSLDQIMYLPVPGYSGRPTAQLADNSTPRQPVTTSLPAEYTESLFEWLWRQWIRLSELNGGQP